MITLAIIGVAAYASAAAFICWATGPVSRR
jgi:hypothetical protein